MYDLLNPFILDWSFAIPVDSRKISSSLNQFFSRFQVIFTIAPFHHHPATCFVRRLAFHSAAKNEQAEAEIMSRFSLHRSGKRHVRPHCNRPIPKVYFASSSIIQLPSDILSRPSSSLHVLARGATSRTRRINDQTFGRNSIACLSHLTGTPSG